MSAPAGSGDLAVINQPTVALWLGFLDLLGGLMPCNSVAGSPAGGWNMSVIGQSEASDRVGIEILLFEDFPGTKAASWQLTPPQPFYSRFTTSEEPEKFGGFTGSLNGELVVEPVPYFRAVPDSVK